MDDYSFQLSRTVLLPGGRLRENYSQHMLRGADLYLCTAVNLSNCIGLGPFPGPSRGEKDRKNPTHAVTRSHAP